MKKYNKGISGTFLMLVMDMAANGEHRAIQEFIELIVRNYEMTPAQQKELEECAELYRKRDLETQVPATTAKGGSA